MKMVKINVFWGFALAAMVASAQDAAAARAAYQREQALMEVPRLSQQFDQLAANYDSLAGRVARIESGASGNDELRAEIVSLRSQLDQLRRDQERMRAEIINELGKKIAALPRPAPPPPPPPAAPSAAKGGRPQPKAAPAPEYTGSYYEHVVKPGQTLSVIAKGFDVPMNKILQANPGLKANSLRAGQKIRVPAEK